MNPPDCELLERYSQDQNEAAFVELVQRHLDLVYAAALRQTGGVPHLAQEITQTVFNDLAGTAASLTERRSLAGCLYTSTRFAAARTVRPEVHRGTATQDAAFINGPKGSMEGDWEQLQAVLDDAMHELDQSDRESLLLRYLEGLDLRSVSIRLGVPEEEVRKRVERALDQLRRILPNRGITSPGTLRTLATVLSASGLVKAPPRLPPATVAMAALASSGSRGAGITPSHRTKATKLKSAFAAACVIAMLTALVLEHNSRTRLVKENSALQERLAPDNSLPERRRRPVSPSADLSELQRLRQDQRELLRLRAELAALRKQLKNQPPESAPENTLEPAQPEEDSAVVNYVANVSAKLTRGQTLLFGGWTMESGKHALGLVTPETSSAGTSNRQVTFQTVWVEAPAEILVQLGLDRMMTDSKTNSAARIMTEPQTRALMESLVNTAGVDVLSAPKVTTSEGLQARVDATQSRIGTGETFQLGPTVDLVPTFSPDGNIDLTVNAKLSQLKKVEVEQEAEDSPLLEPVEENSDDR